MECKLLDKEDIELMEQFVDDENTKYDKEKLMGFLNENNSYGFIVKNENKIVGFAYGYVLLRPDGNQDFYLHAIDIIAEFQGKGYGTKLMNFIKKYIKEIKCRKMFLITNKSNISACRCYEKAGGVNNSDDEIVYVYK
jgi:ribosomal protein S18 acetylase RimI-like enzyme